MPDFLKLIRFVTAVIFGILILLSLMVVTLINPQWLDWKPKQAPEVSQKAEPEQDRKSVV